MAGGTHYINRERDKRIIDMLSSHSILEVAEMTGLTAGRISQIKKAAGLPPRWGNGHGVGYIKPKELEVTIPPVVAEIVNRPKPQPVESRLPVVRAAGFEGYPGCYVWCWSCGFRTWQAPGVPLTCPKCARTLQIVYTPRKVGDETT